MKALVSLLALGILFNSIQAQASQTVESELCSSQLELSAAPQAKASRTEFCKNPSSTTFRQLASDVAKARRSLNSAESLYQMKLAPEQVRASTAQTILEIALLVEYLRILKFGPARATDTN